MPPINRVILGDEGAWGSNVGMKRFRRLVWFDWCHAGICTFASSCEDLTDGQFLRCLPDHMDDAGHSVPD
jgi:hypothetical protein